MYIANGRFERDGIAIANFTYKNVSVVDYFIMSPMLLTDVMNSR